MTLCYYDIDDGIYVMINKCISLLPLLDPRSRPFVAEEYLHCQCLKQIKLNV